MRLDVIKPGKYIRKTIDGVATSKCIDQVFKIPDGAHVQINLGGDVEFTNGGGAYELVQMLGQAGWKHPEYFINKGQSYIQQWQNLFNAAQWIR